MKLGRLTLLKIKPNPDKTEFQFLLSFAGRLQPVEFEMTARGAMLMMGVSASYRRSIKYPFPVRCALLGNQS